MAFLWFGRKKKIEDNEKVKGSFESVKKDMAKISSWIHHLNGKDDEHEAKIEAVYDQILQIRQDIDGIKSFITFFDSRVSGKVFKQQGQVFGKQTAVCGVQTGVQTAVQTALLRALTSNERLIVWTLANNTNENMKLSCEDIAVLLGKESATVRGQINNIKLKTNGIVSESLEKSGKKRYFMEEKMKEMLLKSVKVRARNRENNAEKDAKIGQNSSRITEK
ncbi:MAG: hypothetical protein WC475_02985 [Candidatus Paceibacterota bacterium]